MQSDFLATGLMLQYSLAHGNETEGTQLPLPDGLYCAHAVRRPRSLCQINGGNTACAQDHGRRCEVYSARARGEAGLSRRVLQQLDQRSDAHEN